MKKTLTILVVLLLSVFTSFAENTGNSGTISNNGARWASEEESGEFNTMILCVPSLTGMRTFEDLGNFFLPPAGTDHNEYIIDPPNDEFLKWEIKGPVFQNTEQTELMKYSVESLQVGDDGGVTLEMKWTVDSRIGLRSNLGGLGYGITTPGFTAGGVIYPPVTTDYLYLKDGQSGEPGSCDGIATFKINAITLTVYHDATLGVHVFPVTVTADATIGL